MSEKKPSHNNHFRSKVFTDSLEGLGKLISSKGNYIIAVSILSLGIALGSSLANDRFAKKWLEKKTNTTLLPILEEIEENKDEQIDNLKEQLDLNLAQTDASIQAKEDELANRINKINSETDQKSQNNKLIRQKIRKNYENEIIKMNDEDELDERVKKAVEQETKMTYPTDGCWWRLFEDRARCKYSERRYKELRPDIKLAIQNEVADIEQELEQKLIELNQKYQAIIDGGEKNKADVRAIYNEEIKDIQQDQKILREEFQKQEDRLIMEAIVATSNEEEKIKKDINSKFYPTALRVAKISAIVGSIFGAITTIIMVLILTEYVFLKTAISDKICVKRYKTPTLWILSALLICCVIAISLKLFTAKTEQEKEQIVWIALPTAGTGALISLAVVSSGFLIQELLVSKNPVSKDQDKLIDKLMDKL